MNPEKITLKQVAKFLKQHDDYLILTHISPDGDTLGSGFALNMILSALGKKSTVVCDDEIPNKFSYITNNGHFAVEIGSEKTVVSVDVADIQLLGSFCEKYGDKIDLNIDHHISNTCYAKYNFINANAAANCENIFALAKLLKVKVTEPLAAALYTGLTTDTGCFRYSNTTPQTLRMAAELYDLGIDYANINRIMFETKSRSRFELEKLAYSRAQFYCDGKCSMFIITQEMILQTGCDSNDAEGITAASRCIEGVLAGITVKEKEDGSFKVSLRSFPPVDASKICKQFGGGGHLYAAGCQFPADYGLENVCNALIDAVKKELGE